MEELIQKLFQNQNQKYDFQIMIYIFETKKLEFNQISLNIFKIN